MAASMMRAIAIWLFIAGLPLFTAAQAQTPSTSAFPNRSIRLIVPFPAGGPVDAVARTLAPRLGELLGQPVVIDNRAGGGTVIGTEIVARAPADGHTCLIITSAIAINPSVIRKMPYDATRDLAAVTRISSSPFILITHPAVPARNAGDLIKLAKARPGELLFASSGIGGASHLSGVQFNLAAGINTVHVPYKGTSPLLTDLVAGQTQFNFSNPLGSMPLVQAGKLKVLGVGAQKRMDFAPGIPTISESGLPGFETGVWFAFFTTGGTPRDTVQRLNSEMIRTLSTPDVRQKLTAGGAVIHTTTPDELSVYLRGEIQKWAQVVKAAGVTPE
jgi:tripartite-type tricarboxylate transporter receptor subunit TctC